MSFYSSLLPDGTKQEGQTETTQDNGGGFYSSILTVEPEQPADQMDTRLKFKDDLVRKLDYIREKAPNKDEFDIGGGVKASEALQFVSSSTFNNDDMQRMAPLIQSIEKAHKSVADKRNILEVGADAFNRGYVSTGAQLAQAGISLKPSGLTEVDKEGLQTLQQVSKDYETRNAPRSVGGLKDVMAGDGVGEKASRFLRFGVESIAENLPRMAGAIAGGVAGGIVAGPAGAGAGAAIAGFGQNLGEAVSDQVDEGQDLNRGLAFGQAAGYSAIDSVLSVEKIAGGIISQAFKKSATSAGRKAFVGTLKEVGKTALKAGGEEALNEPMQSQIVGRMRRFLQTGSAYRPGEDMTGAMWEAADEAAGGFLSGMGLGGGASSIQYARDTAEARTARKNAFLQNVVTGTGNSMGDLDKYDSIAVMQAINAEVEATHLDTLGVQPDPQKRAKMKSDLLNVQREAVAGMSDKAKLVWNAAHDVLATDFSMGQVDKTQKSTFNLKNVVDSLEDVGDGNQMGFDKDSGIGMANGADGTVAVYNQNGLKMPADVNPIFNTLQEAAAFAEDLARFNEQRMEKLAPKFQLLTQIAQAASPGANVRIVDTPAQLPASVKKDYVALLDSGAPGQAMYDKNSDTVYIVHGNIQTVGDAIVNIHHEAMHSEIQDMRNSNETLPTGLDTDVEEQLVSAFENRTQDPGSWAKAKRTIAIAAQNVMKKAGLNTSFADADIAEAFIDRVRGRMKGDGQTVGRMETPQDMAKTKGAPDEAAVGRFGEVQKGKPADAARQAVISEQDSMVTRKQPTAAMDEEIAPYTGVEPQAQEAAVQPPQSQAEQTAATIPPTATEQAQATPQPISSASTPTADNETLTSVPTASETTGAGNTSQKQPETEQEPVATTPKQSPSMTPKEFADSLKWQKEKGGKRFWVVDGASRYDIPEQKNGKLTVPTEQATANLHKRIIEGQIESLKMDIAASADGSVASTKVGAVERMKNPERYSLNAEAVDAYGITLPEGYVREGDMYVYQKPTSATTAPTAQPEQSATEPMATETAQAQEPSPAVQPAQEPAPQEQAATQQAQAEASNVEVTKEPDGSATVSVPSKDKTTIAPKEQKKWLLTEVDKAIEEADDKGGYADMTDADKFGKLQIEVPGDGVFTVLNEKGSLKRFKERMEKSFPSTDPKNTPMPSVTIPRGTNAAKVGVRPKMDGNDKTADKMLAPFKSDDDTRPLMKKSFYNPIGGEVVATNGRMLAGIITTKGGLKEGAEIFKDGDKTIFPDYTQVVRSVDDNFKSGKVPSPKDRPSVVVKDTEALSRKLIQANSIFAGSKERGFARTLVFVSKDGNIELESYASSMNLPGVDDEYKTTKGGETEIGLFNPTMILDAVSFLRSLGNESITFHYKDGKSPLLLTGAKEYVLVMPLQPAKNAPQKMTVKEARDAEAARQAKENEPKATYLNKADKPDVSAQESKPTAEPAQAVEQQSAPSAPSQPADLNADQIRALRIIRDLRGSISNMAGTANKALRQRVYKMWTGESLPSSQTGINMLRDTIYKSVPFPASIDYDAGRDEYFRKWLQSKLDGKPMAEEVAAAQEQPASPAATAEPAQPAAKLEDFGEKIGGARKDMAKFQSKDISDEDLATKPFGEIWPKSEVDSIEDNEVAAIADTLRSHIPSKPHKAHRVKSWVDKVKSVKSLMQYAQELGSEAIMKKLEESPVQALKQLANRIRLLGVIDRKDWGRVGEVAYWPDAYTYNRDTGAQERSPYARVTLDSNTNITGVDLAGVAEKAKEYLGSEKAERKMQFEVRGTESKGFSINKKGDPLYRKLKTFDTTKEAFEFIKNEYESLAKAWEDVKDTDNVKESDVRREENRPRTGKDHRQGKPATPQMFMDAFGFRGVEFGNWVSQGTNAKERQGMLDASYDALMDLADILGIPSKALSLEGSLGLGLGSRGSGKASAHFESDTLAINLTKTRGAGTLAHEWFHALDNYFQRKRDTQMKNDRESRYITYSPETHYVEKDTGRRMSVSRFNEISKMKSFRGENLADRWTKVEGVRPEVEEAFAELVKVLDDSPMNKRSQLIDKGKSGGYWSRIIERAARAFENYIIAKMQQNGYSNDYLANVTAWEDFARDGGRYPYLMESELKPVADAFDNLFSTVQTKKTENGNVTMFRRAVTPEQDAGNVIPLSERFNDATGDVRFRRSVTSTPEFKAWFKDSKVVDADGKPMVVYHGAPESKTSFNEEIQDRGMAFFSESDTFSRDYGASVQSVYLSIKNPFDSINEDHINKLIADSGAIYDPYDEKEYRSAKKYINAMSSDTWEGIEQRASDIKGMGYDGMIVYEGGVKNYVAFSPNQIKSATANVGTFDPANDDIRFRRAVASHPVDAHPGSLDDKNFIPASVIRKAEYPDVYKRESSRKTPIPDYEAVVGGWYEQSFGDETEIEQMLMLNPAMLTPSEQLVWRNDEGRGWDSEKYSEWMAQGLLPPPIKVIETEKGEMLVIDGHRRFAAALKLGKPVLALVSPVSPTPELSRESYSGRLIGRTLTKEMARRQFNGEIPEWNDTTWADRVKPFMMNTTMFRRGVSPREAIEKRYVRAMPSTDPLAREMQAGVEVDYAYNLTPTTVKQAMNDAQIAYERDEKSKLTAQMNLLAGSNDSGDINTDAERMATDKIAVDDLTMAAVSNPKDDNKIATAMLGIWRWYERGTDVARALQLRVDPVNTPEGRRMWIMRTILAPTKSEAEIIRKAQNTKEAVTKLMEKAKYARKVLEALKKKDKDVSTLTADQLMDDVFVAKLLQDIAVERSGWGEMVHEWWRNAILSAPTTQIVNTVGNTANAAIEAFVQRPVEALMNSIVGNKDAATFRSNSAMYKAIAPSIQAANKAFLKSWATERTVTGPGASKIEESDVAIKGTAGKIIRVPQRLMSATDEWFKTIFMAMLTADYATRDFDRLVKEGKKAESERDAYVSAQTSPNSAAYVKAWDETLRWSFQQKPGRMAASIMHWRNDPQFGFLLKFIFPFVKTPANIISSGIRKTPLGALPYMYNLWRGNYKGGDAMRLGAEQAVGMVLMASLYALMKGDDDDELNRPRITGSRRSSATTSKGAKEAEMQNTPPMSIRIGDKWVSYARLEPIATMVATMVDALTVWDQAKDGKYTDIPETVFSSIRGNLSDKTFLQGVGNMVSIIEGDELALQKAVTSTLAGFNPNIIRSTARALDPYIRDMKNRDKGTEYLKTAAERFGQTAMPAASLAPIPKMDKQGRPIERDGGALYNATVPFKLQDATKTTKVDAMLARWNNKQDSDKRWYPATPDPVKVKIGREEIAMTDAEYVEYQRIAGEHAAMVLGRQSFNFENPTERDVQRVKDIYENARKLARERIRPVVVRRWRSEQVR